MDPQPPQNPVPSQQSSNFVPKSKFILNIKYFFFNLKNKKAFLIIGGLVSFFLVLICVSLSAVALTVYTNVKVPILSDYKTELSAVLYKIPLLPKTEEQILLATFIASQETKTYRNDLTTSIEMTNSSLGNASLNLKMSGDIDVTDLQKPNLNQNIDLSLTIFGQPLKLSTTVILKEYEAYLKINDVSENILTFVTSFLSPYPPDMSTSVTEKAKGVFAHWIKLTNEESSDELEKTLREQAPPDEVYESALKGILSDERIMSKIEKKGSEKINDKPSHHLQITPDKEFLEALYEYLSMIEEASLTKEDFASLAQDYEYLTVDLWIGKDKGYLTKLSFSSKYSLDKITPPVLPETIGGAGEAGSLQLEETFEDESVMTQNLSVTFTNHNEPVDITLPTNSVTVEEFFDLFTATFQTIPEELTAEKATIDRDLSVIRQAITSFYVANGTYPDTLEQLVGVQIPSLNSLSREITEYSYRKGGNDYVVFTTFQNPDPFGFGSDSPYYGFSSQDGIVRQLSVFEINPE